tara:strand:- start:14105 stop:14593 length:489 start_codon:yes stop_codon:yes gene_type:complete
MIDFVGLTRKSGKDKFKNFGRVFKPSEGTEMLIVSGENIGDFDVSADISEWSFFRASGSHITGGGCEISFVSSAGRMSFQFDIESGKTYTIKSTLGSSALTSPVVKVGSNLMGGQGSYIDQTVTTTDSEYSFTPSTTGSAYLQYKNSASGTTFVYSASVIEE